MSEFDAKGLTRARSLAALLLLVACDRQVEDFVPAQGAAFVYDAGARGSYYFPETMGAGVALFDADNDGALDVYWVQGGPIPGSEDRRERPTNRLFLGDGAGALRDATESAGDAAHDGYGMGVCAADVNGDGATDLFLTNVGPDCLLLADPLRPGTFVDATPPALADPRWNTACALADLDRDGHLDLGVVGYVAWSVATQPDCGGQAILDYCSVELFDGLTDRLWKGDGRGGFVEITEPWGFGEVPARGLGLAFVDVDTDGFVDAYVANDTESNRLYLNREGRTFADHTAASGAGASADGAHEAGMGVAVGDLNLDGLPDLVVTNFAAEPNSVYQNRGQGWFRERSRAVGVAAPSLSRLAFGVNLADFDGDGRVDLFTACGHVSRHVDTTGTTFTWKQCDQLLMATSGGNFEERPLGPCLGTARVGRGSAVGDLDGDGVPDLVVSNSDGEAVVVLNRMPQLGAGSLSVALATARGSNTGAIGASVTLALDDDSELVRWLRSGTSYLSQDEPRVHFALPPDRAAVELRVRWPDGEQSTHPVPGGVGSLALTQP